MGSMEAARVKKAYLKLLLAFEQHLSQECKTEVRKVCTAPIMCVHVECLCLLQQCIIYRCLTGNSGKTKLGAAPQH